MTIKLSVEELFKHRNDNGEFLYHTYRELLGGAGGIFKDLFEKDPLNYSQAPLEIGFTVNGVQLPFQMFNDLENKLDAYIEKEAINILRKYVLKEVIEASYLTTSALLELAGRLGTKIEDYDGMLSEPFKERFNL